MLQLTEQTCTVLFNLLHVLISQSFELKLVESVLIEFGVQLGGFRMEFPHTPYCNHEAGFLEELWLKHF